MFPWPRSGADLLLVITGSMLSFLIAITQIVFRNTDTTTRSLVLILLSFSILVVILVVILECTVNSPKGSARQRLYAFVVRQRSFIASWNR